MDGLETELGERARLIRLNIAEEAGHQALREYGVKKVPTLLLLDDRGTERYRTEGRLPRKGQIKELLAGPQ
ncbi:MAG TPA: hypothetical protein VEQ11_10370 [Chloroflexota bacterium]|nr:hypothetical protein [Chloroflexota bacterium]